MLPIFIIQAYGREQSVLYWQNLLPKKVIFTVHGKFLDSHSLYNRISIYLSDGVILLNEDLYKKFYRRHDGDKFIVLPSIFLEGLEDTNSADEFFNLPKNKQCILLYAYDKTYHQGEEIYGIEFILDHINLIDKKYQIVLLDISGKYKDLAKSCDKRVIYINKVVNFFSLLRQVEIYVRPTCMDGSSIAIQEALLCNTPVLASNVVDRSSQVVTYKHADINDFLIKLKNIQPIKEKLELTSIQDYLEFCEKL
jgi:glycosyltransferase involved in cell wall biosynthesis